MLRLGKARVQYQIYYGLGKGFVQVPMQVVDLVPDHSKDELDEELWVQISPKLAQLNSLF